MFGSSPKAPEPIQTPPAKDDPAVEEARRKQLEIEAKAKGRAATILTGGQGDTSEAPVTKKRLLGE